MINIWYNSIFTPDIFQTWFNDWIRFFSEEKCLNYLVAWWIWIKSAWIWDLWQNLVMLTCLSHFHLWKFGKHDNRKNGCSKVNLCGTGSHIDFADRYVGFDLNRIRFSSHSSATLSGWQTKYLWIESFWFSFISYNSQFSIKILKTASKKPVGFNSLFYKFYSGTFFMIATATTTTLCLNYNPVPLCMLPFLRLFFLKMLLLVNTQTNHETACNIF